MVDEQEDVEDVEEQGEEKDGEEIELIYCRSQHHKVSVYVHASFMGAYVSLCILGSEGEQSASSQGALVLVYVYTCPQRL